jgi:hypothetical protein
MLQMILLLFLLVTAVIKGQNYPAYETRQAEMRDVGLSSLSGHTLSVQACQQMDIDAQSGILMDLLADIDMDRDAAFRIVMLIRIFSCTDNETVKETIKNAIATLPYWLTTGETTRVYWTENQQSMWMSSAWLLQEQLGIVLGDTLRQRLVQYLQIKRDYGYSEFFSSVYFPYTLSGLINLVDFCQDDEIRQLAMDAAQGLLKTILLMANSRGQFIPAAGRNFAEFYLEERAIAGTIWMLTGLGNKPTFLHHATAFLATSNLPVNSIIDGYTTFVDTSIKAGPTLSESFEINSGLTRLDRAMFQWSMGGYFHPDVADDTQYVLDSLDLWGHGEFADFSAFESLPSWIGNVGSQLLASITESSVISGYTVNIYRNMETVLSSVQNFWPGQLGYQVYPWAATTGTKAVWTQSGKVQTNWGDRPDTPSNTHLPYIDQQSNVALIMYNPNDDIGLLETVAPDSPLAVEDFEVALRWPTDFQGEMEIGNWILGRETDGNKSGYVAVYRHCMDSIEGIPACRDEHQTWAVVVGNSAMYTSFENFAAKIAQAKYNTSYGWSWSEFRNVFHGEIEFEGIKITHSV